VTATRD